MNWQIVLKDSVSKVRCIYYNFCHISRKTFKYGPVSKQLLQHGRVSSIVFVAWSEALPHVEWTSDVDWDPTSLDQSITNKEAWYDTVSDLESLIIHSPFDEFGNFKEREADLHFFDVGEIPASDVYGEIREPPDMDDVIKVTIDKSSVKGATEPIITYGKKQSTSVA